MRNVVVLFIGVGFIINKDYEVINDVFENCSIMFEIIFVVKFIV